MPNRENHPKLRWACRRGMLELDIFLGNFLTEAYNSLSEEDQSRFVNLLSCEDQDLFMWLTGKEICHDPDLNKMVQAVRLHANTRHHA